VSTILTQTAPELRFGVQPVTAETHVAVPTLRFPIAIETAEDQAIRSVLLDVQIQIAARQRRYGAEEADRLLELFGSTERWSTTLRTLLWTRTTVVVAPVTRATGADLKVPCSYDLEVTASRYFAALEDGEVPLELLFSGTVFFAGAAGGLQVARISWESEVGYRLPVAVWREAIDRHFPGAAWLRLGRASFDRLYAYKARHAFTSWDSTIDTLLEREDG
jgi:hypothetical protein